MPRPKTIPWKTRVQVFLCFRRLGKAYPTAKRFKISRSTVGVIVSEFKRWGFSPRARAKLSAETLSLAQERHLQQVSSARAAVPQIAVQEPSRLARASLDVSEALGDRALEKILQRTPVRFSESLMWHLKDTLAERTITEANAAIIDYDRRCFLLWKGIQTGLEAACRMPILVGSTQVEQGAPFILGSFVDLMYGELWSRLGSPSVPYGEFGDLWRPPGNLDMIIMRSLSGADVTYGKSADPQAVGQGILKFLSAKLPELRAEAQELTGLWHDLEYLDAIVKESLDNTREEDIRAGICPECPFPEVGVEGDQPRKRVRKGAQHE